MVALVAEDFRVAEAAEVGSAFKTKYYFQGILLIKIIPYNYKNLELKQKNMILTTTNSIEDYKILEYRGIVSGTAANMQKTTMTFNMQKYYEGISESISEVQDQAFAKLNANAEKLNANAIVGINVEIELSNSAIIIVTITGTAVSIIKK